MVFASSRVNKFLRDQEGTVQGRLLDNGQEIRFSAALGNRVASIISEGSLVPIEGVPGSKDFPDECFYAIRVTNLESRESATLPVPKQEGKPGMQLKTPTETASLANPEASIHKEVSSDNPQAPPERGSLDLAAPEPQSAHPASFFHGLMSENSSRSGPSLRNHAARRIGMAYDSLHKIQAILAYLHIINHGIPGISQFLDEAKHTYEQALARFATIDFSAAKEFAEASASLSRVVEIVTARTLRSDSSLPSLMPPPPRPETSLHPEHVEEDLAHAETVLSRIHWVPENGTLPSEDRAQVRKIASWGDAFCKQARRTYRGAVLEGAFEFAQAALAGAYSAEHVCRKWYVSHPWHP